MNYWHIQLHPNERLSNNDILFILKRKVIGMGVSWQNNEKDAEAPKVFQNQVNIGDVVLVRNGKTPIALVEISSDAYIYNKEKNGDDGVWFNLRRHINILDYYADNQDIQRLLSKKLDDFNTNHIQATATLTRCNGNNATNNFIISWHKYIKGKNLMLTLKINDNEKKSFQSLWQDYKNNNSMSEKLEDIDKLLSSWNFYRQKIIKDEFTLDDYTNTLSNIRDRESTNELLHHGGYLCNFLERTTRSIFGASKPGTAIRFGVKLNNDNTTYTLQAYTDDEKTNHQQIDSADREKANGYFESRIKDLITDITKEENAEKVAELIDNANYSAKKILLKLAVLNNPCNFLHIYSDNPIDRLYKQFFEQENNKPFTQKNYELCHCIKELLEINDDIKECILLSRFLYEYATAKNIADEFSPNIIFYGAPGTGKTHEVLTSVKFLCKGNKSLYEFVQFHPSFGYEDFIEGIKPAGVAKDGNLKFELINGVFKEFCIKANNNPDESHYFIVDEINRANLSSVFGETLSLLEKDYRDDSKKRHTIKTQYSTLIEKLITDNPNHPEYISLAYRYSKEYGVQFGIPSNVFFIGMMNDVDKSIDSFDLALRRRFKWIRKDCDYDVIADVISREMSIQDQETIDNYVTSCEALNKFIVDELGLTQSYMFGHAFFLKIKDLTKKAITTKDKEQLFREYLSPTLKEYLRSLYAESELDSKLESAMKKFILIQK